MGRVKEERNERVNERTSGRVKTREKKGKRKKKEWKMDADKKSQTHTLTSRPLLLVALWPKCVLTRPNWTANEDKTLFLFLSCLYGLTDQESIWKEDKVIAKRLVERVSHNHRGLGMMKKRNNGGR